MNETTEIFFRKIRRKILKSKKRFNFTEQDHRTMKKSTKSPKAAPVKHSNASEGKTSKPKRSHDEDEEEDEDFPEDSAEEEEEDLDDEEVDDREETEEEDSSDIDDTKMKIEDVDLDL